MKRLIIFLLLFAAIKVAGQTIGYLRFDSVMIYKNGGTAELILMNKTKDTIGILTNYGNGRTRFIKSRAINDSTIVVGLDTLTIRGANGTGGGNIDNVGAGHRIIKPGTQQAKTLFSDITGTWDSVSNTNGLTYKADTSILGTQFDLSQKLDSIHIYTATDPDPDSIYAYKNADSTLVGYIPKGGGAGITTEVRKPLDVLAGDSAMGIPDTVILTYDGTLDTTALGELTVNPAILPSINPGVYFSPGQNANPAFIVKALAIVAPTNSHSHGVDILWHILNSTSDHNSSFFDSVYGNTSNGRLELRFPNVKQVLYGAANPDEINAQYTTSAGPSVGLSILQFPVFRNIAVGFRLTGDGSGTWTVNAGFPSLISPSTHNTSTGVTGFNLTSAWGVDYNVVNMQYHGTSGYRLQRQGAFSSYNVSFKLTDDAGNPVALNPTSSDEVIITNAGMHPISVSMATWLNNSNEFMSTAANWFVDGWFECWMVAAPTSTTAIQVRWQTDYPSATNYKIYRSSTGLYGTFTLIHTGTEGVYADAGLTANTRYTYKMVAVVGGIDTDVTTFTTNTKF